MVYLDTSVALAYLLSEDRQQPTRLWDEVLVSSRLLTYELWTRLHTYEIKEIHREASRSIISRVSLLEMTPSILDWIVDSIPNQIKIRTLDAFHLATCIYLINQGQNVLLASYVSRMNIAATATDIPLIEL